VAGGAAPGAAAAGGAAPGAVAAGGAAPAVAVVAAGASAAAVHVAGNAPARPRGTAVAAPKRQAGQPGGAAPTVAATSGSVPMSMPMSIRKIVVESGHMNFSDLSVQPNFSADIQDLGGTISGLSTQPKSQATMNLHGSVDKYSPVSINGRFSVLGPKLFTDIGMSFRNIELTIFNPYSGKFAGYNISKGKLTTELHYKVDGRALDAQHHIIVEQLEFGDKTASKDAVSLPVKLAVALLKDRNGVIDLNLPVSGSLDDPQFRLAPLVWKVLVNLLEKAITAPFALLGSLFGGGPDIQFIDFQPGVSSLDTGAADKLKTVAKALGERPQLNIAVPIAVVAQIDGPALGAARYDAELRAMQAAMAARKKSAAQKGAPPPYAQLDPAAQLELLTQVYAKDFGGAPKFPDTVTSLKSKADVNAAKIDFLAKAVREHIQVGDDELQQLGQQRAMALQQALLTGTEVTAERVFLVANDKASVKDGAVRLELSLQ
jgi:hypothetical protein